MYGLPNDHPLSLVVFELTETHPRETENGVGPEIALLALLRAAVRSNTSGASGSAGGRRATAPIDLSALAILDEITAVVDRWSPTGKEAPLERRLQDWASALAGQDREVFLREMCDYWVLKIRELLEPSKYIPLRGSVCPCCRHHEMESLNADGELAVRPLLMADVGRETVFCLHCGCEWAGEDRSHLAAVNEFWLLENIMQMD